MYICIWRRLMIDEIKGYYLSLDVYQNPDRNVQGVWCGDDKCWISIEDAYESMFRTVLLMSSKEAYELKEEMESTGFFTSPIFKGQFLEINVRDSWNRNTYIFFDWNDNKGITEPISAIRCDSWGKAERYFKQHHKDKFKTGDGQVLHISRCKYMDLDKLKNLQQEADLIKNPKNK